ncbi:MAG: tRNA (adenosine(37)-N6)-threonylcarbamoyltransferase complex ATPase subunit type 1 TsaE [Balneolales bacterium]
MIEELHKFLSHSPEQTLEFGRTIAKSLKPGNVVCLHGDIGSGKTHLVKGIASFFGIDEHEVQSPTFTIINEYEGGSIPVYHFDFYRINTPEEATRLGIDEYFYGEGICLIEWPSKINPYIPEHPINIRLKHRSDTIREILVYIE